MRIRVKEYLDDDRTEAIVEICDGATALLAFRHPHNALPENGPIRLRTFLAENICAEQMFQPPRKLDNGLFSYRLTAEVVNTQQQIVCVGNVTIALDTPLPKDIQNGDIVSFDVMRLDVACA